MLKDKNLEIIDKNQALFVDLDDKSAQRISGGVEMFIIGNALAATITYNIDGAQYIQEPYSAITVTRCGHCPLTLPPRLNVGLRSGL